MRPGRAIRIAILALFTGAFGALFVRVLLTAGLTGNPCGPVPPLHGRIEPGVYALGSFLAFAAGGLFAVWRTRAGRALADEVAYPRGDVIVQTALFLFLAVALAALVYEAYALATPGLWPITFYVRCANYLDPGWTLLAVVSSSALLGHWLWRPWGPR